MLIVSEIVVVARSLRQDDDVAGGQWDELLSEVTAVRPNWDEPGRRRDAPAPGSKEETIAELIESLNDDNLSSSDPAKMREPLKDIKFSDILKPGIYQMEFQVLRAEHREWVRVNASGNSNILTGRRDANGNLRVSTSEIAENQALLPGSPLSTQIE